MNVRKIGPRTKSQFEGLDRIRILLGGRLGLSQIVLNFGIGRLELQRLLESFDRFFILARFIQTRP